MAFISPATAPASVKTVSARKPLRPPCLCPVQTDVITLTLETQPIKSASKHLHSLLMTHSCHVSRATFVRWQSRHPDWRLSVTIFLTLQCSSYQEARRRKYKYYILSGRSSSKYFLLKILNALCSYQLIVSLLGAGITHISVSSAHATQ